MTDLNQPDANHPDAGEPRVGEPTPPVTGIEPPAASQPPSPPPPSQVAQPPAAPAPATATAAPRPAAPPPAPRRRTWPRTLTRLLTFLFGILQALLILRIVLLLLIANPDNEIVAAILRITEPFVEPFRGMFQLDEITGGRGSILDVAAVVALIFWTLVEMLVVSLIRLFDRQPSRR
jgi:uncharacterized protein YggT (Ycf19 family)